MPGSNIQNPGSSKQEEVTSRGVRKFSALKKTESQTWGGNAVKKNRVPTFLWLCFFLALEKNRVDEMWGLVFFHSISPHVWDSVFFHSWNGRTPLSPTSSCILELVFRLWLPSMLWHYNLHQTKLFKDFAQKKSNLVLTTAENIFVPN